MLIFKTIIFDFDGVIAETEHGRYELLASLLFKYGIELKRNFAVHELAGTPTDLFLKKHFTFLSNDQILNIVKERRELFFNDLEKYCTIYPGAPETIRDLTQNGYNLILATTNDSIVGEKLLKFIGIENEFSHKLFRDSIQNTITNKKDYSLLTQKTLVNPSDCVVIEDSLVGVSSAKANSFYCIAFNRYNEEEISLIADKTIDNYKELRSFFNI